MLRSLTTAADWDKLIDTRNYVPLENSDNSRLGSVKHVIFMVIIYL